MSIYYLGPWLADKTYKHAQKLILLAIANCVNEQGVGFISHQMICDTADVSDEYVRQSIRRFVGDGVLEVVEPPARGRATVYRLALPRLSEGKDGSNRTEDKDGSLEAGVGGNAGHSWGQSGPELGAITPVVGGNSVGGNPPTQLGGDFDAFWKAYPRKAEKQAALKAWAKAVKLAPADVIVAGAERYRDDPNREAAFTKHAATWLNAGCWDDEPLPPRSSGRMTRNEEKAKERQRMLAWAAQQDAIKDREITA